MYTRLSITALRFTPSNLISEVVCMILINFLYFISFKLPEMRTRVKLLMKYMSSVCQVVCKWCTHFQISPNSQLGIYFMRNSSICVVSVISLVVCSRFSYLGTYIDLWQLHLEGKCTGNCTLHYLYHDGSLVLYKNWFCIFVCLSTLHQGM